MSITLNGTTGIAGVDGTASAPSVQGADANTGVFFPAADTVAVSTAGTERMRVDSSGNLGLGVTPSAWQAGSALQMAGGQGYSRFGVTNNSYYDGAAYRYVSTAAATLYGNSSGSHLWFNAPSGTAGNAITFTQAMTLDASGNLLVGTTSSVLTTARLTVQATGSSGIVSATSSNINLFCVNTAAASWDAISFRYNTSTEVGKIACTSTATAYNTSSDYRLKENVQPMTGALDTIAQLNPVTYNWKVDGSDGQGFIAHELQAVVPDCVSGEKDAVDDEGNPKYQGVDTSFLVATLVKAVQEQQTIITALEARIAALEAK